MTTPLVRPIGLGTSGKDRIRRVLVQGLYNCTRNLKCRPEPLWKWKAVAAEAAGRDTGQLKNSFDGLLLLEPLYLAAEQEGRESLKRMERDVSIYLKNVDVEAKRSTRCEVPKVTDVCEYTRLMNEAQQAKLAYQLNPTPATYRKHLETTVEVQHMCESEMNALANLNTLTAK